LIALTLIIQEREGARIQADLLYRKFDFGSCNSLTGTKFGCGAGLCGACMVHIDGKRAFSCQTQVSQVAGKAVTTIEGLSADSSHPIQKAWLAERVPQCGYCQSGQIMSAADLLAHNPKPDRSQIVEHMSTNICRCGSYPRIVRAIERAAKEA
jgi:isoquinoline 1-oxidoreductase alpha subunit